MAAIVLLALPLGLQLSGPLRPHLPVARASCIVCGWGPEPIFEKLSIESITEAASGLKSITVAVPAATSEGYVTPGQYVQIRQPGAEKAGFFAIASAPGAAGPFEFLIKEQPPSDWSPGTGWLTDASAGAELEMSQVMGGGFKFADKLDGVEQVLCFAAGSGISPIRSVLESGSLKDKDVSLYYGAQTTAQMAYVDKFDAWKESGVSVTPVLSKPDDDWSGSTGYVQDVAKAAGISDGEKTLVLLCGMKGMFEGVKEVCTGAGIDEENILANF